MDTTVVKGMRVLEALASAPEPVRLAELASALGLQRSNTHRLLSTLTELGYVEREAVTGRYKASLRLWEFGTGILARHPLKRFATPYMQELHKVTGETVSLTMLDDLEVLYLDKIVSPRPLKFSTQPGSRLPAILNAGGRAMLVHEPDLETLVARSITTIPRASGLNSADVFEELEKVRRDGYAVMTSSLTTGIVGVAAPIMGRDGRAAGALTTSGPAQRFRESARSVAAEAVQIACARIAEAAGGL